MNGLPGAAFNLQQSEISIYHRSNDGSEERVEEFLPVGAHEQNTNASGGPRASSEAPVPTFQTARLRPLCAERCSGVHRQGLTASGSAALILVPLRRMK